MHRYLYSVYCLTLPTSLCSDNTQNLHRLTVEKIPRQCQHPSMIKIKGQYAGNKPITLILANRPRIKKKLMIKITWSYQT